MKHNKKINLLKKWCIQKSNEYYDKHLNAQGLFYICFLTTNEIAFKLLQLIDYEFKDDNDFIKHITAMLDVHYDYSLKEPYNHTAKYMIDKIQKDFLLYFQQILIAEHNESFSESQYERVIIGSEADKIISQFNIRWEYFNDSYWFPLMGNEPQSVSDKFFMMKQHIIPHWNSICDYIFKENNHIYSYGRSVYDIKYCMETSTIEDIHSEEWAYTDKDFTWFIYFSHEDTVSFAGTIVPKIKDILLAKKEHWDRYEYQDY